MKKVSTVAARPSHSAQISTAFNCFRISSFEVRRWRTARPCVLRVQGAGPGLRLVNPSSKSVAPAFVGFESWAPRTSILRPWVTARTRPPMLHRWYAQLPASLLWRGILPLHHHQLLSVAGFVRERAEPGQRTVREPSCEEGKSPDIGSSGAQLSTPRKLGQPIK